jgi:hypothetical protein
MQASAISSMKLSTTPSGTILALARLVFPFIASSSPAAIDYSTTALLSTPPETVNVSFGCSSGTGQNVVVVDKVVLNTVELFGCQISLKLGHIPSILLLQVRFC